MPIDVAVEEPRSRVISLKSSVSSVLRGGEILRNTYNETNSDLVTGAANANDISKNSIIEIVTSLAGTSNDPEVMLQRTT